MKQVRYVLVVFMGMLVSLGFGTTTLLQVQDLLRIADENNLQIQISTGKYQVALAQTQQAWSLLYPKISASAGVNRVDSYQSRASMAGFSLFSKVLADVPSANLTPLNSLTGLGSMADYYSAKVSISQMLFSGSVFPALVASDYALKGASAGLNATREEVYSTVLTLAFSLIQTQKNLEVLQESRKQIQLLLTKVTQLEKNGLGTPIDVLRTKSSLSGLNVAIIQLNNTIANLYQTLELTLNQPVYGKVDAAVVDQLNLLDVIPSLDRQTLLLQRNDYQQLLNTSQLMDSSVDIQAGNYWPTLMLSGAYGYTGSSGFNFSDSNRDWTLGVNGSWNLFDFGATQAKVDEAKANANNIHHQIEQSIKAMENDFKSILLNIHASKEKIDAITEEVTVNEDAFKLMNSRYNLGDVTNLELLDAHNQLLNARKNLVEAKIDCANQILRYLRATGQLLSYFKKGVSK